VFEKKPKRPPIMSHYLIDDLPQPNVRYRCVVQSDLSLICPAIEVDLKPTPRRDDLRNAAVQYLMAHRAAPKLTNGKSAVGAGVSGSFNFRSTRSRY
jgi:hypothetical protein